MNALRRIRVQLYPNPLLRCVGAGWSCHVHYCGRLVATTTGETRAEAWQQARARVRGRYLALFYGFYAERWQVAQPPRVRT